MGDNVPDGRLSAWPRRAKATSSRGTSCGTSGQICRGDVPNVCVCVCVCVMVSSGSEGYSISMGPVMRLVHPITSPFAYSAKDDRITSGSHSQADHYKKFLDGV